MSIGRQYHHSPLPFADVKRELVKQAEIHLAKGDPRDVAAYAAFLWFHNIMMPAPKRARTRKR